MNRFNTQPVVNILYRRALGGIIHKQQELGRLMFIRLATEVWGIG
jgi:hypothetical protein